MNLLDVREVHYTFCVKLNSVIMSIFRSLNIFYSFFMYLSINLPRWIMLRPSYVLYTPQRFFFRQQSTVTSQLFIYYSSSYSLEVLLGRFVYFPSFRTKPEKWIEKILSKDGRKRYLTYKTHLTTVKRFLIGHVPNPPRFSRR